MATCRMLLTVLFVQGCLAASGARAASKDSSDGAALNLLATLGVLALLALFAFLRRRRNKTEAPHSGRSPTGAGSSLVAEKRNITATIGFAGCANAGKPRPADAIARFHSDYKVDLDRVSNAALRGKYVESHADHETLHFLAACAGASRVVTALSHTAASLLLEVGFTRTSANALTRRAGMFVLSEEQLLRLCPQDFVRNLSSEATMLDIGAGDGGVTALVAKALGIAPSKVVATEASVPMRSRLRSKGYKAASELDAPGLPRRYDVVCCFNVLDRVDDAMSLLETVRKHCKPGGIVLMAIVLPFCPSVESLGKRMRPPKAALAAMVGATCKDKASFETSLERLCASVLQPAGFEIVNFTKVPYLCSGDLTKDVYLLPDAVLVMRVPSEPATPHSCPIHV
eukprot:TRINITY_DN40848_c0_g1_i1.p1 TRINITY_DN40848_c0_g1~~TRINITY_DN40848_c0_g1_i1.p1  ORF type:complete len:400 (+),score=51.28 TRINITY_DN40848_c0_g1_i1:132-1331(+)